MKRDRALAEKFRNMSCQVCGSTEYVCGHHLISWGSSPELDKEFNLIALCTSHHQLIHLIGLTAFLYRFKLQLNMQQRGFEFNHVSDKWFVPHELKLSEL